MINYLEFSIDPKDNNETKREFNSLLNTAAYQFGDVSKESERQQVLKDPRDEF